jgi:hypothetical protein
LTPIMMYIMNVIITIIMNVDNDDRHKKTHLKSVPRGRFRTKSQCKQEDIP